MYSPALRRLRNSSGAFDLPSIITGVVVVGILTAGVLAAIFGVIPFAQDNGAKQDLSSIRTAEGVAKAKDNRFMDHAGLLDVGYLQLSSTKTTKVMSDEKGTCYIAIAKSGTGTVFFSTDRNTDPAVLEADTDPGCLTPEELAELIDEVGGIGSPKDDGTGGNPQDDAVIEIPQGNGDIILDAPENLKIVAVSPFEAKATWTSERSVVGYKVEYQIGDSEWVAVSAKQPQTFTNIIAKPQDIVSIRVSAVKGEMVSEPAAANVRIPTTVLDSVFQNPGFEDGSNGWVLGDYTTRATDYNERTGIWGAYLNEAKSFSQAVTIPRGTPVLTYWTQSTPDQVVSVDGKTVVTAPTGAVYGKWVQRASDLSGYADKTVTIKFSGRGFLDDVALEAPGASSAPSNLTVISTSGNAKATWVAPIFSGGGIPVTSYTVTAMQDGREVSTVQVAGDQRSAVISGVDIGSSYTFQVAAGNDAGTSMPSNSFGPVEINAGLIANPGFENGATGWTLGKSTSDTTSATTKHTGKQSAYLNAAGSFSQAVAIPGETPMLTYWARGTSQTVSVDGKTVATVPTGAASGDWVQRAADLSGYAGQAVTIKFSGIGFLDDVAFEPKG